MFIRTFFLTDKEKQQVSEMTGKIMLWILEGQHIGYMSEKLNLDPYQIENHIDETLYVLKNHVGIKRYLKILFRK